MKKKSYTCNLGVWANQYVIINAYWAFFHAFCRLLIFFFQNQLFRKNITGKQSYCQTLFVGPHLGPNCLLRVKKAKIFT